MSSFWSGFEKAASPRWVKELRKMKSVPTHVEEKLKSLKLPMREVRHLGTGASQIADEVFHPVHGVAVRKTPLIHGPLDLPGAEQKAKETLDFWHLVKKVTGGGGPFAHIKGNEGLTGYYEKAVAHPKDRGPRLHRAVTESYKREHAAYDARDAAREKGDMKLWDKLNQRGSHNSKRYVNLRSAAQQETEFTGAAKSHIDKVKEHYPEMGDLRQGNIVGGKIVDAEPGRSSVMRRHSDQDYKNPAAESKKHFAAETRAARGEHGQTPEKRRLHPGIIAGGALAVAAPLAYLAAKRVRAKKEQAA